MKGRIQVVGCKCCTEMPPLLNMDRLMSIASEKELVVSTSLVGALCEAKNIKEIVAEAKEKEVDKVVVLACAKKDVSSALLKSYRRAGVNEFLIDCVDLRDEVVLPHADEPQRAQAKAEIMVNAALDRMLLTQVQERAKESMRTRNVVVIGGGVSGRRAAESAARTGAHAIIIEKSDKSFKAPGVLMPRSTVVGAEGYGGNFTLTVRAGEKVEKLECAAVVVATGGGWTQLKGSLAKACKTAMPLYTLNEIVRAGDIPEGPVIIVDTPDPAGKSTTVQDYAWDEALNLALDIKKKTATTDVWVVFQEMRAFGLSELMYKEASDLGVRFVRYDKKSVPKIDSKDSTRLLVDDASQGETYAISFGTLAFASIPPNPENAFLADILRVQMSPDGGIRRGSIQRWPVSTPRRGVFVCGSALFPKSREIAEFEGEAAGMMAGQYASTGVVEYGGIVAEVTQEKCSACLTCVRTCPYEAPFIGSASKAEIRTQLCEGCGMCAGICPSRAIEMRGYTDDEISQEIRSLLGGEL